jgi:hypothetical protein
MTTGGGVAVVTGGWIALALSSSAMRAFWASMVFCICSTNVLSCLNSSAVCVRAAVGASAHTTRAAVKKCRPQLLLWSFLFMVDFG